METIESLGKYEIKRTLGRGAMGTVYEGWDPIIARRVAIKTVKLPDNTDDPETEDALARFRREAQAAGRLTHPNIVGVFDYGETNDLAYIVMEFVDGPPLKNLLDKQERFALADTLAHHGGRARRAAVQPRARRGASRHQAGQRDADQHRARARSPTSASRGSKAAR